MVVIQNLAIRDVNEIEVQAIETGKLIHHKMCGHAGERMVKVWVLNNKGEKEPVNFLVAGY